MQLTATLCAFAVLYWFGYRSQQPMLQRERGLVFVVTLVGFLAGFDQSWFSSNQRPLAIVMTFANLFFAANVGMLMIDERQRRLERDRQMRQLAPTKLHQVPKSRKPPQGGRS